MKRPELLAPAGDLEKLKIAVRYGADAVYIGGKQFSLRARSSNFSLSDIEEACLFAHQHGSKVYVTTNILPHDEDVVGLDDYLQQLQAIGVDAVICASVTIMKRALAAGLEVHVSTQASVTNSAAVDYYHSLGATRVVLARELSLHEIEDILLHSNTELEVFVHGGMCSAYSGRCTLSNHMTGRDSNRGGCAHSCRWDYGFIDDQNNPHEALFSMGSKDLNGLYAIPELMSMGVHSIKIEGRMKSIHYIATIVGTYRRLLDQLAVQSEVDLAYYANELQKAENRETSDGFLFHPPTHLDHLYDREGEHPTQRFIGIVLAYKDGYMTVEERNKFSVGMEAEIYSLHDQQRFTIQEILDADGQSIDDASHAQQIVRVKVPFPVEPYSMLRKVME